jgi:HEAT repeat protein
VRAILLLALWAPLALAQGEQELRELIDLLGSKDPLARAEAARRIAALGADVLPKLRAISTDDPEVARALRALMRRQQKIRLALTAPKQPHSLGSDLRLRVEVVNDTEETLLVPLVRGSPAGKGTWSAFLIDTGADRRFYLRPDQVELEAGAPNPLILFPGDGFFAKLVLAGESSPLRTPGRHEIAVAFLPPQLQRRVGTKTEHAGVKGVRLEIARITIDARGRKPAELGAALGSDDKKARFGAIAELAVREDPAVLPLLRKHGEDPDLALIAVRRLGAVADEQDLEFVRAATRHRLLQVRRAAVTALGNYRQDKARRRLALLLHERDLTTHVVRALTRHKHPATIDCFLSLLRQNYREGEWVQPVIDALYDWTGIVVRNRRGEIAAFDQWWRENRQRWIEGKFTRK